MYEFKKNINVIILYTIGQFFVFKNIKKSRAQDVKKV